MLFFCPKCPKKEFLLRVSYMEIYNETVTDLLVDSWKRKPLEVRETINVSGLFRVLVFSDIGIVLLQSGRSLVRMIHDSVGFIELSRVMIQSTDRPIIGLAYYHILYLAFLW